MGQASDGPLTIAIISGATGRTARQVVRAALAQFAAPEVEVRESHDVRSARTARRIVRKLPSGNCVICHSLVAPTVRNALLDEAQRLMIPCVDVLGQLIAILSDHLGVAPQQKPGLAYATQKDYFDRMDAVSFTLDHDDGAHAESLDRADVVLVGVSRVSKSVTCFYLGYRGVRAANVPLIPDFPPPPTLLELPPERVIGLTTTPHRLHTLRETRRHTKGGDALDYYCDPRLINEELRYAVRLMKKHGWTCMDVSYMAVEEVAVEVLKHIGWR